MAVLIKDVGEASMEDIAVRLESFIKATPDHLFIGLDKRDAQVVLNLLRTPSVDNTEEIKARERKRLELQKKIEEAQRELEEVS